MTRTPTRTVRSWLVVAGARCGESVPAAVQATVWIELPPIARAARGEPTAPSEARRVSERTMTRLQRLNAGVAWAVAPSDATALLIVAFDFGVYLAALAIFCLVPDPVRFLALAVASIMVGALFLVGHDAAHRALFKTPWLNVAVAHLAFMPTLHPQSAWIIGHNRRHHGFTNLRGIDYVWTPWSAAEYMRATPSERRRYGFYRTLAGVGWYYAIEIWWPHMWHVDRADAPFSGGQNVAADRRIALGGFAGLFAACLAASWFHAPSPAAAIATAVAAMGVPFVVYQILMSIVIFIHHTHPAVRWYSAADRYDPLVAPLQGTVHIRLPVPVELLFHDIFQHNAHHLNPNIPLYRLKGAQRSLEQLEASTIVQATFSLRYLRSILRECQLYDYDAHRWLTIADVRTTAQTPVAP